MRVALRHNLERNHSEIATNNTVKMTAARAAPMANAASRIPMLAARTRKPSRAAFNL